MNDDFRIFFYFSFIIKILPLLVFLCFVLGLKVLLSTEQDAKEKRDSQQLDSLILNIINFPSSL